jgi:hypothetical protein
MPPPARYYTILQLYTANKLVEIIGNELEDDENRIYYEYKRNDFKEIDAFYFTDSKGEYLDINSEDPKLKADIKNSLSKLKSYFDAYNKDIAIIYDDIPFVDIYQLSNFISKFSPTKLGKIDKRISLYDSVYKDVKNEHPYVDDQNEQEYVDGGKRISKGKSKKVAKKPAVSQKKQSVYKEIFGKQMKIYKMPDSRKEYVKYKGELHPISEYKSLMKQKAMAKPKSKK